ncbi:MAG TPA: metallophosphoesterase [Gemmatimonadales bacterium]|jgi:predicted MPP superfamily phosphohydrolase
MIGPLWHPRRRPPSEDARPPRFELAIKVPIGWVLERLARRLAHWERAELGTPEIDIAIRGLPREFAGYRIALVTDMHRGPVVPAWWLERVADRVTALAPDLVVLGGDFVSHAKSDLQGLQPILARYGAPDGSVAVLGNHDHWVGAEAVAAVLRGAGAELLHNRHRLIRRGAAAIAVAGVDDFTHGAVRPRDALRDVPRDVPRVLISHNPDLIEYLPADLRVDLMLSGHTHNGQVHWPIIGPLTVPSQFGRRYMHGLHQVGERWIYVSAGVGSSAMPLRWGNPPELPVLRLVPS